MGDKLGSSIPRHILSTDRRTVMGYVSAITTFNVLNSVFRTGYIAVGVEGVDITIAQNVSIDGRELSRSIPMARGNGLYDVDFSSPIKHLFHQRIGVICVARIANLVVKVPNNDSRVSSKGL